MSFILFQRQSPFQPIDTSHYRHYRLTIKEHVIARTSAGFWSDQTRTIHEVCNSTPFVLNNGKYSIEVVDALAAELLGKMMKFTMFNLVADISVV